MKLKALICFAAGIFLSAGSAMAEDKVLSGTLSPGWHYVNGAITTQGETVINDGVSLDLIARTTLGFYPGFRVMPGGSLLANASPDTDGDRVLDVVEQRSGCLNFQLPDTDGDSLTDSQEDTNRNGIHEPSLLETSACNPDTDGDSMDDGWETAQGLDPLVQDADEDPDGDSLSNAMEYFFRTSDPHDGKRLPKKGTHYEYDELGRIKRIIRIK